ncbi:5'-nucleotidase C-terminal domain-containing protein [Isoptericola sp. AK164]|uniref:bifunctional metallophosphatase/5'-nucleotidase n=1 Tax=Isoptericola sp. AK164 TaxID=3024246 RepID=UPI00241891B9|nr:5'-nucleotidase C-terminal domain-containing protein [Isoptericola sp. AK164]
MSTPRSRLLPATAALGVVALTAGLASPAAADDGDQRHGPGNADFTLTILHNNDGESSLLPTAVDTDADGTDDAEYGGIARFVGKVDALRRAAYVDGDRGKPTKRGVVTLNSGDNFLAGTTFQASQQEGAPFYDALAQNLVRYDALGVGNHEFDFGPAVFGELVEDVKRTPFVSANLDYSAEESLAGLEQLVPSTVIRERGEEIGVVGLTTPSLPTISSSGDVEVLSDLAGIAQEQVDLLTEQGIEKIVLVSHLQGLSSEIDLVGSLTDVDVVVGGGGDEILADGSTQLFPGDVDDVYGEYPQIATDADGAEVPVVTTPGNYRYVGQLAVTFDADGVVVDIADDSGIKVVTDTGAEAVGTDRKAERTIEQPVADFEAALAEEIVATSEVVLDCERSEVRGVEANCGNLIADAHLWTAQQAAADFGLDTPQVAVQNGGGIRGEIDQEAGPVSVADTFRLQPFGNFVAVAEDVPVETFRQILEEGAFRLPESGDGAFVQAAGFSYTVDTSYPARDADQSTGEQFAPGERVRSVVLDDGAVLVEDGVSVDGTVDVAGLNFSLNGGDAYPTLENTTIGVSDQQSLENFLVDGLGGVVSQADYPRGGEGRITIM